LGIIEALSKVFYMTPQLAKRGIHHGLPESPGRKITVQVGFQLPSKTMHSNDELQISSLLPFDNISELSFLGVGLTAISLWCRQRSQNVPEGLCNELEHLLLH